jgi:3'(2'), 5'-bisphosphate nucleotidase
MKIYPTDFAVSDKPEHDPVTEADRLASRLIVQGLRRDFPGDFLRLVSSLSHRHGLLDEMRRRLGISEERRVGSVGVKVGLLLAQEAHVYLEPSTATKAWDSCAPEAVLSAAGGRLTDLEGTPLRYTPHNPRNSRGIAATNGACHDFVISKIAPVIHGRG